MMCGEQVEMRSEGDILDSFPLESYDPAVRMRRTFLCKGNICKARLYVTAHGIYDVCINGKGVTDTLSNLGFACPLKNVSGTYESIRGKISVGWEKTAEGIQISGCVPANPTAILRLSDGKEMELVNGVFAVTEAALSYPDTASESCHIFA